MEECTCLTKLRRKVAAWMNHKAQLVNVLNNEDCICNLVYSADMVSKINDMNSLLQRKSVAVFDANAEVISSRGEFVVIKVCCRKKLRLL